MIICLYLLPLNHNLLVKLCLKCSKRFSVHILVMKNANQSYHSDHVGNAAFEGSPLIDPKLITEQAKVNDIHLTLYNRQMSQKGFVYKRSP